MAQMRFGGNSNPSKPTYRPPARQTQLRYQPARQPARPQGNTGLKDVMNTAAQVIRLGQRGIQNAWANRQNQPAPTANQRQMVRAYNQSQQQKTPIQQYTGPKPPDPRNNPANWRGNSVAAQAGQHWTQQYGKEWGPGQYGVNYGNNWTRSTYTPPVDWRMGEGAAMQMTAQEYAGRRNAWNRMFQPGYNEWIASAAQTPNQPHWLGSDWANANPPPAGFLQLEQERVLRQNAAPPGYSYKPYGSTYDKMPELPPLDTGGTGGWGGDSGWGYGGGYGGGGWDYNPGSYERIQEFWNNMVNWSINRPQGG